MTELDNLVIGGNLRALQFALKNGYPIIYKELELPFEFDYIDDVLTKRDYLEYMSFLLCISGLNCYGDKIENIQIDNNKVSVYGKKPWKQELLCKKIHDFRVNLEEHVGLYQVVDWINIRSIGSNSLKYIDDNDRFVNKILFYPSQRQNKSKLSFQLDTEYEKIPKDIVSISFLTKEQLEDESYSPVYSRLKTLDMLKKAGIKGKKVGFSSTGKPSTAPIKLEFDKREIFIFDPSPIFVDLTSKNEYVKKVLKYFSRWKKN